MVLHVGDPCAGKLHRWVLELDKLGATPGIIDTRSVCGDLPDGRDLHGRLVGHVAVPLLSLGLGGGLLVLLCCDGGS